MNSQDGGENKTTSDETSTNENQEELEIPIVEETDPIPFFFIRKFLYDIGKCWHLYGDWETERTVSIYADGCKEGEDYPVHTYLDERRRCKFCKRLDTRKIYV